MNILAFDTFEAVARLKAVNFTESQAKEIVDTLRAADTSTFANKDDIREVKDEIRELKSDIKDIRTDIKTIRTEMVQLETRLEAKISQVETKLEAKIEKVDAKIDRVETKLWGEINLIKWMLGFTLAAVMTILYLLIKK